jgi:hypothetical protein
MYHGIELPEQDNIDVALGLARETLATVDAKEAAARLGCELSEHEGAPALSFDFMGDPITVVLPAGTGFYPTQGNRPIPDFFLVLVLHYLISEGTGLTNEPISFVQVPSGSFYEEPFNRRTKKLLLATFGEEPALFAKTVEKLGWEPYATGDAGAIARPFPNVPITFVLYGRDEEFEPDANILFDGSIIKFLPTEDIAMISGLLVGMACKTGASIKGEEK